MITVKPLEWNKYDEAAGFDCRYTVYQGGDGWTCVKYPHGDSHYRLAEDVPEADARAAAFADYSARIMSAIEPAGVGVETASDDETLIGYILRYGGMCRDCADMDGVCQSGQPCDTGQRKAVVRHTIAALTYGIKNGFIANPFASLTEEATHD